MRLIDDAFRARLSSGLTTICLCWRLERVDGFVIGLTDHDQPLVFRGEPYSPNDAVVPGEFATSDGLAPGRAAAMGALSASAITEQDLRDGAWNNARVDVFRVDWEMPQFGVQIWSGGLSEVSHSEGAFEAELVSLKANLETRVGRVYSRRCDAVLGDARCGIDLDASPFAGLTCDQRFSTCVERFSNAENFRGFPHMPGNDAVLAGPAATGNTGGRR
ncbi:MAG: DUF2163 domain-containing protein [Pseudomonadota bacterium]